MGNIKNQPFTKIFQNSKWWDLLCNRQERQGNCALCDYRDYCGGCRARADAYFDRLDQSDPGCVNNSALWQQLTSPEVSSDTIQSEDNGAKGLMRFVRNEL